MIHKLKMQNQDSNLRQKRMHRFSFLDDEDFYLSMKQRPAEYWQLSEHLPRRITEALGSTSP